MDLKLSKLLDSIEGICYSIACGVGREGAAFSTAKALNIKAEIRGLDVVCVDKNYTHPLPPSIPIITNLVLGLSTMYISKKIKDHPNLKNSLQLFATANLLYSLCPFSDIQALSYTLPATITAPLTAGISTAGLLYLWKDEVKNLPKAIKKHASKLFDRLP